MLFFHLARRRKNDITSSGSHREYKAFVSLGTEETIMGYPRPMWRITCTIVNTFRRYKLLIISQLVSYFLIILLSIKKEKKKCVLVSLMICNLESILVSFVISYVQWEEIACVVESKSIKQILQSSTFVPVDTRPNFHYLIWEKWCIIQ